MMMALCRFQGEIAHVVTVCRVTLKIIYFVPFGICLSYLACI